MVDQKVQQLLQTIVARATWEQNPRLLDIQPLIDTFMKTTDLVDKMDILDQILHII